MKMIGIRKIERSEYGFLREMLYEAIYFEGESEKLPKSVANEPHLSKYVENFGREGDLAFVLVDGNQLIGAAWSRLFAESEKGYGFVDEKTPEISMAIRKNYRSRGFGQKLIAELSGVLKIHGFEKVSLSVDKRNRAVGLYRKNGFEAMAERGTAQTMMKN